MITITKQQMLARILLTILITAMVAVPTGALMQSGMGILPNNAPVAVPAPIAPTSAPVPTHAPIATFSPTETPTPSATLTLTPNAAEAFIKSLELTEEYVQVTPGEQVPVGSAVINIDFRTNADGDYISASVHFNLEVRDDADRDTGVAWNGKPDYERVVLMRPDGLRSREFKVNVCKVASALYTKTIMKNKIDAVQMNLSIPIAEAKADEHGFVDMMKVFKKNPIFDCDGHQSWLFAVTATPVPTATITPTPKP